MASGEDTFRSRYIEALVAAGLNGAGTATGAGQDRAGSDGNGAGRARRKLVEGVADDIDRARLLFADPGFHLCERDDPIGSVLLK